MSDYAAGVATSGTGGAPARPTSSARRLVQLPQPGFQPHACLTCAVELAPAATQLCTSDSETALQIQTYTMPHCASGDTS